jgi:hypothetical protein
MPIFRWWHYRRLYHSFPLLANPEPFKVASELAIELQTYGITGTIGFLGKLVYVARLSNAGSNP